MYSKDNIGKKANIIARNGHRIPCEIIDVVTTDYKGETFYKIKYEGKSWTGLRRYTELEILGGN